MQKQRRPSWDKKMPLGDCELLLRNHSCHALVLHHFVLLPCSGCIECRLGVWVRALDGPSTCNPQRERHNGEVGSNKHRARQVCTDTDEAVRLHQQIEKEALVKVLHQIIQAPKQAFHHAPKCHIVLPAVSLRLNGDGIHMEGKEAAMWPRGLSKSLPNHATPNCLQSRAVAIVVLPHALQKCADPMLARRDGDGGVEQIQVRQLAIDAIIDDVGVFERVVERVVDHDGAFKGSALEG